MKDSKQNKLKECYCFYCYSIEFERRESRERKLYMVNKKIDKDQRIEIEREARKCTVYNQ